MQGRLCDNRIDLQSVGSQADVTEARGIGKAAYLDRVKAAKVGVGGYRHPRWRGYASAEAGGDCPIMHSDGLAIGG